MPGVLLSSFLRGKEGLRRIEKQERAFSKSFHGAGGNEKCFKSKWQKSRPACAGIGIYDHY